MELQSSPECKMIKLFLFSRADSRDRNAFSLLSGCVRADQTGLLIRIVRKRKFSIAIWHHNSRLVPATMRFEHDVFRYRYEPETVTASKSRLVSRKTYYTFYWSRRLAAASPINILKTAIESENDKSKMRSIKTNIKVELITIRFLFITRQSGVRTICKSEIKSIFFVREYTAVWNEIPKPFLLFSVLFLTHASSIRYVSD